MSSSLLIAVILGLIVASLIFMAQYARVSVIRDVLYGNDYSSKMIRSELEMHLIARIGLRFILIELQSFIFFASAGQILDLVKVIIYFYLLLIELVY